MAPVTESSPAHGRPADGIQNLPAVSNTTFEKVTNGLALAEQLDDSFWIKQLGNTVSGLPKVNAFRNLAGYGTPECDEHLRACSATANAEQASIFTAVQNAPGGITIVEGAAGSGKTRSIIDLATALTCRKNSTGGFDQIIVGVSRNSAATQLATDMKSTFQLVCKELDLEHNGPLVIRFINYSTTYQIALANKNAGRPHTNTEMPPNFQFEGDLDEVDSATLRGLIDIYLGHQRSTAQEVTNFNSRRIEDDILDAGYHMMRRLGKGPLGCDDPFAKPDLYGTLVHEIESYRSGRILTPKEMSLMIIKLQRLFADVIKSAFAIVGTEAALMDPFLRTIATPVVRIADESIGLQEGPDLALAAYYFRTVHSTIYFGDRYQPGPFVFSTAKSNPFQAQLELSKFMRLINVGHQPVHLRQNYRLEYSIAKMVNSIWYKGYTKPMPVLADTPAAQMFRKWADEALGCGKTNIVIVNVPTNEYARVHPSDRYSEDEALVVNHIVDKMQGTYTAKQTAILTVHPAQRDILTRFTDKYATKYADAAWLHKSPRAAGSCGNLQASVAIVSLAADDFTGVLNDAKLTLTLATRAKHGLIIVGHVELAKSKVGWQETEVGKVILFAEKYGKVVTPKFPEPSADIMDLLPSVQLARTVIEFSGLTV